ncbi:BQ2448_828 [Microbotryum intermedium]|uniref:BQ2448_828 protein n=1 Tax=Microbotryum intermedium TaxID=269621 RepID=A0A238F6F0_9BASI|nr:BQ2448_828 [Microbotryum intermedium]
MAAIPIVKFPAHVPALELPSSSDTVWSFIFDANGTGQSPFVKGSPTIKATRKDLQSRYLEGPIPVEMPVYRDGLTGATLSYGRLKSDSLKIASSLIHGPLGLKPAPLSSSDPTKNRGAVVSPIVLLQLPNSLPFASLAFGVLASGLTFTAVNPALTSSEIAHILSLSEPAVIITTPSGLPTFQEAFRSLAPEVQARLGFATKGNVFIVDLSHDDYGASSGSIGQVREQDIDGWRVQDWKVLLPSAAPEGVVFEPPRYTGSEDAVRGAVIFWSSGTSGKSKGVILSHKAVGSAIVSVWHCSTLEANERLVGLPPFYHIFGWSNVLMPAAAFGATVTVIQKFDPQTYLRIAQDCRATHLHIAPPVAVLFAKSPLVDGFDLSSVRACTSGGAPLGSSIITQVYKRLGILLRMGYGLSETSGVTGQSARTWSELESELGSTGKVFYGNELKMASIPDPNKTATVGEDGEVLIRSPFMMISYLNNPVATKESFDDDGWFKTGDVGNLDARGNLHIVDRMKEIMKIKGFQVSPAELEDYICSSPLVQDAGVSSIYHEEHATEYPRAYVVPTDKGHLLGGAGAEAFAHALRQHIESKAAPYKWLRGGVVIIDAVPKSAAGKILRRNLKECKGQLVHVYEDKIRAKL